MAWLERLSPRVRAAATDDYAAVFASHAPAPPDYVMAMRMIYDHELILYRGNRFRVELEGEPYDCPPDSFIIIPPGRMHVELAVGRRQGHRYWCHFDWQYEPGYEQTPVMTFAPGRPRYDLCRPAPPFVPRKVLHGPITKPRRAYGLARRLARLVSAGTRHDRLLAGTVLKELLVELLDRDEPETTRQPAAPALAGRVRRILDQYAWEDLSGTPLTDLLADLGFSYEHLCRVFRDAYGVPPLQYIQARRLSRARILLQETDLTAAEVGFRVGYRDPAYFARVFRQATGLPPGAWRAARRD